MAEVSAQERLQIASDLILDAPLGELKEVIADVQALVGGEAVLAEKLPAITRRFNHEKLAVAEGEAAKVVLCEQGELGDGLYFDAASARCVRVNHVDARILSEEGLEEKQQTEHLQARHDEGIVRVLADYQAESNHVARGEERI